MNNEFICIRCNEKLKTSQLWKHTFWNPIVCDKCGAEMHFESKSWLKLAFPAIVSIIFVNLVPFLPEGFERGTRIVILLLSLIALVGSGFYFFLNFKGVTLVEKTKET